MGLYKQLRFRSNFMITDHEDNSIWVAKNPNSWFKFLESYCPMGGRAIFYKSYSYYVSGLAEKIYADRHHLGVCLGYMFICNREDFSGEKEVLNKCFVAEIVDPFEMNIAELLQIEHVVNIIKNCIGALDELTGSHWGVTILQKDGMYLRVVFLSNKKRESWIEWE